MTGDLPALRVWLAEQVAVISEASDQVATSAEESVHDLRVAVARVRSALRTFGPVLATDTSLELALRLSQCAASLGLSRDLEVIGELLESTAPGPVRDREVAAVRGELSWRLDLTRSEVSGVAHARLLADLMSYVDGLSSHEDDLEPLARRAVRRADKRFDAVERDPIALHRARKAAKRGRYAAEVVGEKLVARRLKLRTDGLGVHHDCHVAAARMLSIEVTGADVDERDRILARLEARADDGRLAAIGSL